MNLLTSLLGYALLAIFAAFAGYSVNSDRRDTTGRVIFLVVAALGVLWLGWTSLLMFFPAAVFGGVVFWHAERARRHSNAAESPRDEIDAGETSSPSGQKINCLTSYLEANQTDRNEDIDPGTVQRFEVAVERLVRLALATGDDTVLPASYRDLLNHPDPAFFAGMYNMVLGPLDRLRLVEEIALLEAELQTSVKKLGICRPPEFKADAKEEYRVAISGWQASIRAGLPGNLPPAPAREAFTASEDYEDARGRWRQTVGRIQALTRDARQTRDD